MCGWAAGGVVRPGTKIVGAEQPLRTSCLRVLSRLQIHSFMCLLVDNALFVRLLPL